VKAAPGERMPAEIEQVIHQLTSRHCIARKADDDIVDRIAGQALYDGFVTLS